MKVIVIGGGPAGMAAAVAAKEQGAGEVVLAERYSYLGGVLPQCIHNGFGTQLFHEDYTGGEYAWIWWKKAEAAGVRILLNTSALGIERKGRKWYVKCVRADYGTCVLEGDAVIAATGCRERTLPQMLIPGSRPSGVFTAGSAQLMMNIKNYLPGKTAVILGSGDIGLIMARRMALEGIRVKLILGQEATGLARNIVQCVQDFQIPMRYGWTVISTHGYKRMKGVTIAPLKEDGSPDREKKEYIACDTLLVATGLIPELEVCGSYVPGEEEGLFVCGNAHYVHDLVDHVTEEALRIGRRAAGASGEGASEAAAQNASEAANPNAFVPDQPSEKKGNMVCTVCPKGCRMQVEQEPFCVSGNDCRRGETFARQELENPKRVVTAVVGTDRKDVPVLSVRTDGAVERCQIFPIMEEIKKIRVKGTIVPGQQIAQNVAGTGVNLIATWKL